MVDLIKSGACAARPDKLYGDTARLLKESRKPALTARLRALTPEVHGDLHQCLCGIVLRVAGAWTCWRCGICHRLYARDGVDG